MKKLLVLCLVLVTLFCFSSCDMETLAELMALLQDNSDSFTGHAVFQDVTITNYESTERNLNKLIPGTYNLWDTEANYNCYLSFDSSNHVVTLVDPSIPVEGYSGALTLKGGEWSTPEEGKLSFTLKAEGAATPYLTVTGATLSYEEWETENKIKLTYGDNKILYLKKYSNKTFTLLDNWSSLSGLWGRLDSSANKTGYLILPNKDLIWYGPKVEKKCTASKIDVESAINMNKYFDDVEQYPVFFLEEGGKKYVYLDGIYTQLY